MKIFRKFDENSIIFFRKISISGTGTEPEQRPPEPEPGTEPEQRKLPELPGTRNRNTALLTIIERSFFWTTFSIRRIFDWCRKDCFSNDGRVER